MGAKTVEVRRVGAGVLPTVVAARTAMNGAIGRWFMGKSLHELQRAKICLEIHFEGEFVRVVFEELPCAEYRGNGRVRDTD